MDSDHLQVPSEALLHTRDSTWDIRSIFGFSLDS